jgi:hypothetical protein
MAKTFPMQENDFSILAALSVTNIDTIPVIPIFFDVSLCCTSHPSGSRLVDETIKTQQPLPLFADQKNFGSRPCPIGCFRSFGY